MSRILLGVSGGVAAYKALELVRLATGAGHAVRVVQTPTSRRFVGRASFEALTGAPVLIGEFERDPARGAFPGQPFPAHEPIGHLELVRNADLYLIAPASANTIAKLAAGLADNLLTSAALAATCPFAVAPAMNNHMYEHPAVRANLDTLRARGVHVIEPDAGRLASQGEEGIGRLPDPARLLALCERLLAGAGSAPGVPSPPRGSSAADMRYLEGTPVPDKQPEQGTPAPDKQPGQGTPGPDLQPEQGTSAPDKQPGQGTPAPNKQPVQGPWCGLHVLVTAGGTREPIDSVRFVGNSSSGRMGLALAQAARGRGAEVTVVAANISLPRPPGVVWHEVSTAAQLRDACQREFAHCDVLLMAAAVADFRPTEALDGKLKKAARRRLSLELEPTVDVLSELAGRRNSSQTIVGFAAEHGERATEQGRTKLHAKRVDAVVVNDISRPDIGFEVDANEVTIVTADGETHVPRAPKAQIADAILDAVQRLRGRLPDASDP